jgi:2-amino-4-hydroxy-6-hydroxymethyldihydropteridine diphosphokinase
MASEGQARKSKDGGGTEGERVFVALGANLPSPLYGGPRATLEAAIDRLAALGVVVEARSRWYEAAPVPPSDQPWFVNGVAEVHTGLDPARLLALLHRVESEFGRVRGERNAPRIVDLDLVAYGDRVAGEAGNADAGPVLPHPRMHERAFVLLPLRELAPGWRHPQLGRSLDELIAALPPGQVARPLAAS